jgi:hypothetical protein
MINGFAINQSEIDGVGAVLQSETTTLALSVNAVTSSCEWYESADPSGTWVDQSAPSATWEDQTICS